MSVDIQTTTQQGVRIAVEGCVGLSSLSSSKLTRSNVKTGPRRTKRHLRRHRKIRQGARMGWRRPAHHRRRLPSRPQRRRPERHVRTQKIPRARRFSRVLQRRSQGSLLDHLCRRQPRSCFSPLGTLLRRLGVSEYLLHGRCQRSTTGSPQDYGNERYLEGVQLQESAS